MTRLIQTTSENLGNWRVRTLAATAVFACLGGACLALEHQGMCDTGNPYQNEPALSCTWTPPPPDPGCLQSHPAYEYEATEITRCKLAIPGEKGQSSCVSTTVYSRARN
jgi:hypothetical protein